MQMKTFVRLAVALGVLVAILVSMASLAGFKAEPQRAYSIIATALISMAAIGGCFYFFFYSGTVDTKTHGAAGASIACNAVTFIVLGVAALIVATEQWPTAVLWAGACLLGGGFFGLLFGVPLQTKAQDQSKAANPNASAKTTQERSRTLLGEAADTFSKFLTGAAAVKYNDIYTQFKVIAGHLATCLRCCGEGNKSFAAGLILYFSAVGFVAGILLPQYYMQDILGNQAPGGDQPQPGPANIPPDPAH